MINNKNTKKRTYHIGVISISFRGLVYIIVHIFCSETSASKLLLRVLNGKVKGEIEILLLCHFLEPVVKPLIVEVPPYCHCLIEEVKIFNFTEKYANV